MLIMWLGLAESDGGQETNPHHDDVINGNILALLALSKGNPPVTDGFP